MMTKQTALELINKTEEGRELHIEAKNITTQFLVSHANKIENLFDDLYNHYTTKKVGLAFLSTFYEDFNKYKENHNFIKWLHGITANYPNLNITMVDDIIQKFARAKSFNLDSNLYEMLIDITKYNCSGKALETCADLANSILNISSDKNLFGKAISKVKSFFGNKQGDKDLKMQKAKGEALGLVITAMNEIILKYREQKNIYAINNSFGVTYEVLKRIQDAELANDIIFSHWKSDELLGTIAGATVLYNNVHKNKSMLVNYFADNYKFTQLFKLLTKFHSSHDLRYYLLNYQQIIKCFSFDTVQVLLADKQQDSDGIKENCIDYMCTVYNIETLKRYKNAINISIRKFILDSEQTPTLRKKTFNKFIAAIEDEKQKREFVDFTFSEFFTILDIKEYGECIMCRNDSSSIEFAMSIYKILSEMDENEYAESKLQLQTRLENKIFHSESTTSKKTRDAFYNFATNKMKTKKEISDYSKNRLNQIIKTLTPKTYSTLFSDISSPQELIKYELRLFQLFSKIEPSLIREFSDLKNFVQDNIEDNIYKTHDVNDVQRSEYFDTVTADMTQNEIAEYTKTIMNSLIKYSENKNVGCIFCADKTEVEKMPSFVLNLYLLLKQKSEELSVPKNIIDILYDKLKSLLQEVPNISLQKEILQALTKDLSMDAYLDFSSDLIKNFVDFTEQRSTKV